MLPRRRASSGSNAEPDALELVLRDRPGDEKSGASASLGFSFQQWWAALVVAELLGTDQDFAVGVEVKEDVAVLDSSTAPTRIEFCQVKKNERVASWPLKDLHKRGPKSKDGAHPPSILGKLYSRRHEFAGHTTPLRFVSNVGFHLPAEDGSSVHSADERLERLTPAQQQVVSEALAEQLGIDVKNVNLQDIRLQRTNLPLAEQELFVGGKLGDLSSRGKLPFTLAHASVAARVLASELQSKASGTSYARTYEDLKHRILSRAQALDLLGNVAAAKPPVQAVLDEAIEHLRREAHPFLEIKAISSERVRVCTHACDRTNLLFRDAARALLVAQADVVARLGVKSKLGDLMAGLVDTARQVNPRALTAFNEGYLQATALLVLNDGIDINVLTASSDSEPEAAK